MRTMTHHFKIYKYCPKEEIFDGIMTYTEARKFMDENATFERRVSFEVFDELRNRWENFGDSYHGGRKVYNKEGNLYILDPDYRNMWRPEVCRWYIWEVSEGRLFITSMDTKEKAESCCKIMLQTSYGNMIYKVEPCDIEV